MSAPDPKAWQLQQDELDAIECNLDIYGIESRELQDPVYAVARRRALAELKALFLAICPGCANGKACYHSHSRTECPTQKIHDRIAEIEAEG